MAVATKVYCIQEIERPLNDKLLIILGDFHVELAFFAAVGNFISGNGIEYILSEADIFAEGSILGLVKGKCYNRCIRMHQHLANVMKRKMYHERVLLEVPRDKFEELQDVMKNMPTDSSAFDEGHLENPIILAHNKKF